MFIIVVLLCLCIVLIVLVLLLRLCLFNKLPKSMQKVMLAMQGKLMFNSVLRSTIQSYLKMSIATTTALFAVQSMVTTVGFIGWLLSYPIISYKVLQK